jgi:hypothetical protein
LELVVYDVSRRIEDLPVNGTRPVIRLFNPGDEEIAVGKRRDLQPGEGGKVVESLENNIGRAAGYAL